MVEKAFTSVENYLEFFKEIDDIYKTNEDTFNKALDEINDAYGHLLQDEEETLPRRTQFLKPEIPKNKKETKNKRESSRASRRNVSSSETVVINPSTEKSNINDPDIFRRSSRIASKKTILPVVVSPDIQNRNEVSPSFQSTSDTKSKDDKNKENSIGADLEESIMCAPHSTPISLSPVEDQGNADDCKTPNENPPALEALETEQISETASAVKKRIEEFERRAGQGTLLPSKLPMRTLNEKNVQDEKQRVEKAPISKSRFLRSNKVLQEKNTNVEPPKSLDKKPKKLVGLKNNLVGNKVKMGTQTKYFGQPKKKDLKAPKTVVAETLQMGTQEKEQTEKELKTEKNHVVQDEQYEIEHVLGNESSEDEESPKNPIPKWASREMREHPLNVQAWIDKKETVYAWFYNENIKNPKLEELFSETIKMRPRTSSAVWNTKTYFK